MRKEKATPERVAFLNHCKDTHFQNETQILFDYLQENICTATMATAATGILQKSICRYKRTLEKMGLLYVVCVKPCKLTGLKAQWLTTNPTFAQKTDNQLSLFMKCDEIC